MKDNLIELEALLNKRGFMFKECNSRMDYGMVGHIHWRGSRIVMIFQGCFYLYNSDVPVNDELLRIVELIRLEFKTVSRDNNNVIAPVTMGYIEMQKEGV